MPGYASWKQLYKEEYFQMKEEGFDLSGIATPEDMLFKLPVPMQAEDAGVTPDNERCWKQAYEELFSRYAQGPTADFPYREPVAYEDILPELEDPPAIGEAVRGEAYRQRVKGAFHGRCAAVALGKPLEMGMNREEITRYLKSVDAYPLHDYVPACSPELGITLREDCLPSTRGNVRYMQQDDDIHYTLLALNLAEQKGTGFAPEDVGQNWLDNVPYHWFWCASRQAYYHMVNLTDDQDRAAQIAKIPTSLNPWRECIDGQIRCDLWGYICPGDPRAAAEIAYRDCAFSLTKNGCYGGMFVAGCIAAALTHRPDVHSILAGGLACIPSKSRLHEAVRQVMDWYSADRDWVRTCQRIEQAYGHLPFAATINNLSMVTLALLEGNLDYTRTITTAVMCGIDTDCNAGTAGSIVGAAIGIGGIDARWTEPLHDTIHSAVAAFGTCSISEIEARICALGEARAARENQLIHPRKV